MFALVPLSMVVFGVLSAFPAFKEWTGALSDYVFANFVPSAAENVKGYLLGVTENVKTLTAAGVIALLASPLITLHSKKAQVADLGLHHGAGDGNRTRTVSLGS